MNANKEIIASAATAAAPFVAVAVKADAKADKARAIFNECYSNPAAIPQRKDIINRFVNEAGLTKAGAATYLQNFKKKAGLVASKSTEAATA